MNPIEQRIKHWIEVTDMYDYKLESDKIQITKEIMKIVVNTAREAYESGWHDRSLEDHPKDFNGWLEQKAMSSSNALSKNSDNSEHSYKIKTGQSFDDCRDLTEQEIEDISNQLKTEGMVKIKGLISGESLRKMLFIFNIKKEQEPQPLSNSSDQKPDFEKQATDLMWEVGLEYGAFSHINEYELCKRVIAELKQDIVESKESLQKELLELKAEIKDYSQALDDNNITSQRKIFAIEKERDSLKSELTEAKELMKNAAIRMKRARKTLTDQAGQPDCWQMLNTESIESFLHKEVK